MGIFLGTFAAADVATQPISNAMNGTYQNAPEGAPWYAQVGQYFSNVGNAVLNYDEAAGNSLVLPFVAAWKGVSWAWDKATHSTDNVSTEEMIAQVENNPYYKEYRQKEEKIQKAFIEDSKSLVALWEQVREDPDNAQLSAKLQENYQKMNEKYQKVETAGIAQQWQDLYEALLLGINPFDYTDSFINEDYF